MGVRIGAKVLVGGDDVGEETVFAVADETWFADEGRRGGGRKRDRRGAGDRTAVNSVDGAVYCVSCSLVCGNSALGSLAIAYLEDEVGMFVNACVTELDSSEAANVINDVIGEMEFSRA